MAGCVPLVLASPDESHVSDRFGRRVCAGDGRDREQTREAGLAFVREENPGMNDPCTTLSIQTGCRQLGTRYRLAGGGIDNRDRVLRKARHNRQAMNSERWSTATRW